MPPPVSVPASSEGGEGSKPLSVTWIGGPPAWLELNEAALELNGAALELGHAHASTVAPADIDAVLLQSAFAYGRQGRESPEQPLFHVAGSAAGSLATLRRAVPDAVIVLDLSEQELDSISRADVRRAAAADLALIGSRCALRELRRRRPGLATRTALFRTPLHLVTHSPEKTLERTRGDELAAFRQRHHIASPMVLFAGPITETGGLDLAIEAVHRIRERNPLVRLVGIPQGPVDSQYEADCEALGAGLGDGPVVYRPKLGEPPFLYALASVVCLPCRDSVPADVARLAAAAGRPFVGSEVELLLENVEDGQTGHLLPVGDVELLEAALEALIGDPDQADQLGARARERAERELSPLRAAERLVELWWQAARRGRAAGEVSRRA